MANKAAMIVPVSEEKTYYLIERRINELAKQGDIYEVMIRQCQRRGTAARAWKIK